MTERLFFALWPGDRQRAELTRIQQALPTHQGRKTDPRDLHITLVFLGDLKAEQRLCVEEAADGVRASPFELSLDQVGCFPRARVLWCGASHKPQPLLDLLHALNESLLDCGLRPERRPYSPHVTLVRKARPLPAWPLEHAVAWPVSELSLVIARPNESPRYGVERCWPLIP